MNYLKDIESSIFSVTSMLETKYVGAEFGMLVTSHVINIKSEASTSSLSHQRHCHHILFDLGIVTRISVECYYLGDN